MKRVFWFNGKENVTQLAETLRQVAGENTVYVCLGSDKILIESIGPKVGTRIKARSNGSIIVYGIEGDPINALNVQKAQQLIKYAHPKNKIIAINAAWGDRSGKIFVKDGGIRPGSGCGKEFDEIGDESILCTITKKASRSYRILKTFIDLLEKYDVRNSGYYERMARYKYIEEFVNTAADTIADAILLASA